MSSEVGIDSPRVSMSKWGHGKYRRGRFKLLRGGWPGVTPGESITSQKRERSIGTVSSGIVQESPTNSTCEVPERRARTPNITSQKGERSIGTVSSGIVQESPTDSTCKVPERRARTPSTKSHAETSRTKSKWVRLAWNVRLH